MNRFVYWTFSTKGNCTRSWPRRSKPKRRTNVLFAPLLWHACRYFNLSVVRFLLENGADVDSTAETRLHSTPLMVACAKHKCDVVKFLIEHAGADVNKLDANGENCLFYAVRQNRDELKLVEYLISKGVDLHVTNKKRRTPLDFAVFHDTSHIMNRMLEMCNQTASSIVANALFLAALKCKRPFFEQHCLLIKLFKLCRCFLCIGDCEKVRMLLEWPHLSAQVRVDALETVGLVLV